MRDYLGACDAFLFSSKSETQGIVLAEAMAAGLPVTAVSACGVNDIVEDGKNGYLAKELSLIHIYGFSLSVLPVQYNAD